LFPGDLGGESHAVAVDGIESIVLWQAEAKGVDAHFDGARPFAAAGVVADAVELEESGGEVRDGVAADEVHRGGAAAQGMIGAGCVADGAVEGQKDLGIGAGAVVEMPACYGEVVRHARAPAAEGIVGAVIVFYHLEAPAPVEGDGLPYSMQVLGDGGIELPFFSIRPRSFDQVHGFFGASREQGAGPETGAHAQLFYLRG